MMVADGMLPQRAAGFLVARYSRSAICGLSLPELLIALLIFSVGLTGLLSTQLLGMQLGSESTQRSTAVLLAKDIVERIRRNSQNADQYQVSSYQDIVLPLTASVRDCTVRQCAPSDLAAFDLWQWKSLLHGIAQTGVSGGWFGLRSPAACISRVGPVVTVAVGWLDRRGVAQGAQYACTAGEIRQPSSATVAAGARRPQVQLTAYLPGF